MGQDRVGLAVLIAQTLGVFHGDHCAYYAEEGRLRGYPSPTTTATHEVQVIGALVELGMIGH